MRRSGRLGRIALSLASTLTLATLLLGVPALLVALHGRPDHPGTFAGLGDVIAGGRVDPAAVVDVIAAMAWGAWLVISVAIVLEGVAWIRGRPTPRLVIAGPVQPIVRNLVATATLLLGTVAVPARGGAVTIGNAAAVMPAPRPAAAIQPIAVVETPTPTQLPSCVVVPRDTLWGLAETHLKNPLRWREIFELNRGALQPDGRRLEDPNLIIPGWTLHLPGDAVVLAAAPPVPAVAFAPPRPPPVSTSSTTATRTTAPSPSSTVPSTPSTASPPHRPAERHAVRDGHASPDQATDVAVSAVAAAGVIALLTALRLARRRRRRSPPRLARSTQRVERDLQRAAFESADRLDLSLRAFGRALRLVDSEGVRFLAVRNLGEHIEILLDTPLAHDPEGFAPTDDRRGWVTAPDLTTDRLRELADGEPDPAPCLVSLGTLADDTMLVDLETAGLLTIDGDEREVESVIRHLAVELATSEIADHLQVLVVGNHILGEIGDAHPRLRHLDLDSAITELVATGNENQRAVEAASSQMDRTDLGPGTADLSCPTVLVSFEPLDDPVSRQRIEDVVSDRSRRVAAVVPSRDPAHWNVEVHDGVLRLAPLGLVLDPFTLDATTAEEIDSLIAEPHDDDDDIGEVLPARPTPSTIVVEPLVDPPFDLEVRVLGPVEVTGAAQPFARHRHLEITVYLAMHPEGVSDERLKTALWPDQAPKTATFNTAISTTRSHLGRDANGDPHFTHFAAANRRYRLGGRATSDYARFATRVEHARRAGTEDAIADLRSALDLVRGQPFAEVHGFEWAWSEGFVANIETAVANVAHDLAQRYLELGDPDGAIWAAMQGLVGAPADEILYRDRMLACDLAGNPAGVQTVMRELQHAVEAVEPWDGIHPETIALYERLVRRVSPARARS
ncbi:MAG: BTAD domain-containing putative transcriptional regulator [Acidimicrobiia bacterium]